MKKYIAAILASILIAVMMLCVQYCEPEEAELAADIILAVLEVIEEYEETPEQADDPAPTYAGDTREDRVQIPVFSGKPYVEINGNVPFFRAEEYTAESYEFYSELDALGRCGMAMACIGQELMPTEPRGDIGHIKPTGWHSVRYDIVEGGSLYNRCHLLGFQLTGENANRQNLITGTRFMNVEGMLPFENMVADFVIEMEEHVLYRVTPIYEGEDLLAIGVLMEGWSVEDQGDSICFCVFVYNAQPGVEIDYATGESWLEK